MYKLLELCAFYRGSMNSMVRAWPLLPSAVGEGFGLELYLHDTLE